VRWRWSARPSLSSGAPWCAATSEMGAGAGALDAPKRPHPCASRRLGGVWASVYRAVTRLASGPVCGGQSSFFLRRNRLKNERFFGCGCGRSECDSSRRGKSTRVRHTSIGSQPPEDWFSESTLCASRSRMRMTFAAIVSLRAQAAVRRAGAELEWEGSPSVSRRSVVFLVLGPPGWAIVHRSHVAVNRWSHLTGFFGPRRRR